MLSGLSHSDYTTATPVPQNAVQSKKPVDIAYRPQPVEPTGKS